MHWQPLDDERQVRTMKMPTWFDDRVNAILKPLGFIMWRRYDGDPIKGVPLRFVGYSIGRRRR
jgi:hypothetical protein